VPRLRAAVALATLATLGAAASYVVLKQARNGYRPEFGWPTYFELAHVLAWVAILLLATDVVVELVRARSRGRTGP